MLAKIGLWILLQSLHLQLGGMTSAFSQTEHRFSFIMSGSEASEMHGPASSGIGGHGEPVSFWLAIVLYRFCFIVLGSEGEGQNETVFFRLAVVLYLVIAPGDPGHMQGTRRLIA